MGLLYKLFPHTWNKILCRKIPMSWNLKLPGGVYQMLHLPSWEGFVRGVMQVFSNSWYFPVLSVGFWNRKCLVLAARAGKYLASSSGKRRFAIHWGTARARLPLPAMQLRFPVLSSPYIRFTHKSVGNHVLERNVGKVWRELSSLPLHGTLSFERLKIHGGRN